MKNQFVIFVFILICLLAISIAGCSREPSTETPELTPMEQITGEYMLAELKNRVDGITLTVEPPGVFGKLVLGTEGGYFSLTMVITGETSLIDDAEQSLWDSWEIDGDSWIADEETLKIRERGNTEYSGFGYTWDGKYLILEQSDSGIALTMKWRKL